MEPWRAAYLAAATSACVRLSGRRAFVNGLQMIGRSHVKHGNIVIKGPGVPAPVQQIILYRGVSPDALKRAYTSLVMANLNTHGLS